MIFNLKISTISNINWPHCAKVFTTALTTAKSQRVNCKAPILFAHKKHNELIVLRALFPFHGYDMNWAFLHNRLHFENAKALKSFECHKGFYEVDNRIYSLQLNSSKYFSNKSLNLVYLLLRISFRLDFQMRNLNLMFTTFCISYSKYQMSEQRLDKLSGIFLINDNDWDICAISAVALASTAVGGCS